MVSKNNTDLYSAKLAPKHQKFAIKKFTVGVASVLIGTTFAFYTAPNALADLSDVQSDPVTTKDQTMNAPTSKEQTLGNEATSSVDKAPTEQAPVTNQPTEAEQPSQTPSQDASHVTDMAQLKTALNDRNVAEIVLDKDVTNDTDKYVNVDQAKVARKVTVWGSKVDDKTTTLNLGDQSLYFYNKTEDAEHKWDLTFKNLNVTTNDPHGYGVVSFQNNGKNANVTFDNVKAGGNGVLAYAPNATVNLHDVSVTPSYVESSPTANLTANKVDLSGNVDLNAEVNNSYTAKNVEAGSQVTVKSGANVVLTATNSNSNRLQNLTAGSLNVEKGAKLTVRSKTTASNVKVPSSYASWGSLVDNSSAVYVTKGNVKVDGELKVEPFTKDKKSTSVVGAVVLGASANEENNLVVGSTGKLVVDATQAPNTRGVYFTHNNHDFGLQPGGQAVFKMGHGVSNAVFNPDNLILNEGSKLVVETYQDNNGVTNVGFDDTGAGAHSGVITLNLNSSDHSNNSYVTIGNIHGNLTVKQDALLKVVRKVDETSKQAATPILSFGGTGINNGTSILNVDHGSVVLEDALQKDSLAHSNLKYYSYLGINNNEHSPIYPLGMVSMWGTSSTDRVNLVEPKLFKMVRTGEQKGMLFRLEAEDNKIMLTADTGKSVPVKYGTLGNVKYNNGLVSQAKDYQWDLTYLKSVNWFGDFSMNYLNKNQTGTPFGLSPTANVSFKQETPQAAKDDFNNYFNWWSSTNLELGTDLNGFHPFYRPLVVLQNEVQSEKVSYPEHENPGDVTYKVGATDGDWVKVDATGTLSVTPNATTSVGMHNVPVEVSFASGQKAVVYAPVTVLDSNSKAVFNGENVLLGEGQPVFTHKTSNKALVPAPMQALNKLVVYTKDLKTGKYLPNAVYVPDKAGEFTDEATGKALVGVKVTWKQVPSPLVAQDSSNTGTESLPAVVNVANDLVDFPKGGRFPDLGELPVMMTMYGASAKNDVQATSGLEKTLPNASDVVQTEDLTPAHHAEVASVAWKTKPELTRLDRQAKGVVSVDFVDGTALNVPVLVNVSPNMAESNTPQGQELTTPLNQVPEAKRGVSNTSELPTDTKYSWKAPLDVTTPGTRQATVVVTYPDGSQDEVPVKVVVKAPEEVPTDAEKYTPQGQEVETAQGETPEAQAGVSNKDDLPTETKYSWKAPLDVTTPGEHEGTVVVTYPDGSQDEVPVKVVVKAPEKAPTDAEKYTPQGQEVETAQGKQPEAQAGVSNKGDLPTETKYSWKAPLDVTTPGEHEGTVVVTYPDGSQDEVPVKVMVKAPEEVPTDAEKYTPQGQEVETAQGKTPEAQAGVSNKADLPTDTKYSWKAPLDAETPGQHQGTVVVTYPDGSQDEVPVKVVVKAPEKAPTDAEKYTPQGQEVETAQGKQPEAQAGVSNKGDLPTETKYSWKAPLDVTTPGEHEGTVVVTYPDGSQDEVPVKVMVKAPEEVPTDAEKYTPQGQEVETAQGKTPEAQAGVSNKADLPTDTKYSWKAPLDVETPGEHQGTVVVTYPDGSQDEVPVKVVVKAPTDAEKYTPQGQKVETAQGKTPEAQAGVSNKGDLPTETKYSWKAPLDVTTPGEHEGTVVVTYPDGSQDEVPVKVMVKAPEEVPTDAEKYTPQGQEVETAQGKTPEAQAGVSNKADLPTDTKYSWKAPLDVETPGEHQGTVVVTYPDGSQDEVPVKVVVKAPTDAEKYTPQGQEVETAQGKTPEAQAGVSNKGDLPTETKYSWKAPLDVTTPGVHEGTVVVTYPDGSQDEVPVKVVVKAPTDAEKYTPQSQEVETDQGKTPEAQAGVSNKDDLPADTKYSWKAPLDVTTPGEHEGTVVVTYPDGSQDEVPVTVKVKALTDAEKYTPQGQEVETNQGKQPEAQAGVSNKDDLPADTKYSWKAPLDVETPGEHEGTVVVTYPDGSQDEVPVKVMVKEPEKVPTDAEKYTPQGQEVETAQGKTPEAQAGVSNKGDLPTETKYSWKAPLDVATPGPHNGTVVVTYPDGSQDEVPVKVVVKAPEKALTDAEKYTPQGQEVETDQGKTPEAQAGVSNKGDLPADTKYSWKAPLDVTTPGTRQATVVITYPDGSQEEVPVKVVVKAPEKALTDAEKYTPQGQEVETDQGKAPEAQAGVVNKGDLPADTKYSWKAPLDVTTPGTRQATVVVTYPDGSQDEVPVKVVVKAPTDAEKYTPQGQEVETDQGKTPEAQAGVSNKADLPTDTKYSWKAPLDVTTPGEHEGTVVVTYPDGSQEEVPVKVVVKAPEKVPTDAEKYTPQGQEVETDQGKTPEAESVVTNKSDLPTGTKYSWKAPLDVTTPGEHEGTVVVTYPDGSQDEVPVKVMVKAPEKTVTDAEKYTPQSQEVTTAQGKTPEAESVVTNKSDLSTGTKYSWKAPLDVTTPGEHEGTVVVTYPDGSQDEVPVKVVVKAPEKVPTDAEKYTPQGQEVETAQGKAPEAQAGVSNKGDLPTATKYSWKAPLDVTTPGEHEGTVVVTYPDGSQDEVPVKVVVKAPEKALTDAEKYTPQSQGVETNQGETPEAQAGVVKKGDLPTGTKYSWKAPLDVTTPGEHEGTVVVTYPDGSQDEVPVKVVVKVLTDAEKYTPQGQEVETAQGKTPEAQAGVSNKADLPTETKYSWKAPLDVATPGPHVGTVVVTYPDGSQDEVPAKVVVKAHEKSLTDADKYTPQSQEVTTEQGKTPEAQAGVSNKGDLPTETKYSWKAPLDVTTPGTRQATVVVTYPDGSQEEVPVKVVVKTPEKALTDTEKYTPQGQEVETAQGKTPEAQAVVSNKGDLPAETKYSWKAPLDVATPGEHEGTVVVTYPDGSQDEVPVKVTVKAPTDAEKYTPQGQEVETKQGKTPKAESVVTNKSDLPAGTKYSWKAPLDVTTPGSHEGTVVVTYPDGSQDEVPVKVMVKAPTDAEKYTPQSQEVTTNQGKTLEAESVVTNKSDLPTGTKYSWKAPLDVTTPGEHGGTVVVTYPDGSQDEVPVKVMVKAPTDAEKYTLQGQEVETAQGKTPEAQAGVVNKDDLPAGTKYSWKAPLDVTTPGEHEGTVAVTYPDGSQDEVPVKVVVKAPEKAPTDAEKYTPQGQEVETAHGKTPEAQAGVVNKGDLPTGTKYSWKAPLDVTTPGEHAGTVVVTYPDGSQDEVLVQVEVKAPKKALTDAEKYAPQGQKVTTAQGKQPEAQTGVSNKADLPTDTKYSWKTLLDVTTPGEHGGTVVVTYPDGSQDEVSVKVVVDGSGTTADKRKEQTQTKGTNKNALPQTGEKNTVGQVWLGVIISLLAGMLGAKTLNKKHFQDK